MSTKEQGFFEPSFDWTTGTTEVATISVFIGVFLGLPLLLNNPFLLTNGKAVFYIFLYIIGFFGHSEDIGVDAYKKLTSAGVLKGLAFGLIGWVAIQITFLFGLSLLQTSEGGSLDKVESVIFNLAFVVPGEEMVFRDSLPFYIYNILRKKGSEAFSFISSFILSAVAFGVMHVVAYQGDYIAVLKAIIAGVVLGIIRVYGGLLASFTAHALYNCLVIAGLFILPLCIFII